MPKKAAITAIKAAAAKQAKTDATEEAKPNENGDFFGDQTLHENGKTLGELRSTCLDHILAGSTKLAVANKLQVHRNTVNNWCADPRFIAEAQRRQREHRFAIRQRREMTTNIITDKLERTTLAVLTKVEEQVLKPDGKVKGEDLRVARELGYEFRAFREEERKNTGDDVKRVSVNSSHTHSITGDIQVSHSVSNVPFRDFVKQQIEMGVVDVEALDAPKGALLQQLTEHLLSDSDLLEQMDAEDKAAALAASNEE